MTHDAPDGIDGASAGRRLTLTPISFDIVIALAQLPDGLRLSSLAHAIGSPVSSVQAALRVLVANRLAVRRGSSPPVYALAATHPAGRALQELALALPEPAHATAIAVRANPAVELAVVDSAGFLVGIASSGDAAARARLTDTLAAIRTRRPDVPPVELVDQAELTRHLAVSLGLRDRVRRAVVLKGRIPRTGSAPVGRPATTRRQPVA